MTARAFGLLLLYSRPALIGDAYRRRFVGDVVWGPPDAGLLGGLVLERLRATS